MLTLYTAIGTLKIKRDAVGKPVPVVINNHQEYGLSEHELILWSCLAFQILQIYELEKTYNTRLQDSGHPEGLSFTHYLNRLLLRGLIVKGDGLTGVDALYQLLGKLHIQPVADRFSVRLFTCIQLYLEGKIKIADFGRYLKKEKCEPMEEMVLELTNATDLTTAELLACVEQGAKTSSPEDTWRLLYEHSNATYETLADEAQLLHIQYPVLQAIGNLYLNKQISFQQF
ncbi:cell division protein [Lachnospiraceae bacterium 42-17]|jgi:hypothetical protein